MKHYYICTDYVVHDDELAYYYMCSICGYDLVIDSCDTEDYYFLYEGECSGSWEYEE